MAPGRCPRSCPGVMEARSRGPRVVPGRQGPVTVLIMPGEHRMKREQVSSFRFSGVIVPTDYGSMAVVGERLESVEHIVDKMKQAIVWDA